MATLARIEQNPNVTKTSLPTLYYVTVEAGEVYLNLKIPIVAKLVDDTDLESDPHVVENFRDLEITDKPTIIRNQYNAGPISTTFTKLKNDNTSSGAIINFRAEGGGKIPGTGGFNLSDKKGKK
jgi:hypothetical protein